LLPNRASIATYGGPLLDYSPESDSSTDRMAAGANPAFGDLAALTRTGIRTWARITLLSSGGTPVLVANDEMWNNGNNSLVVVARTGAGVVTLTYPATVIDEIPATRPGYLGFQAINFRGGWANSRAGTAALYVPMVVPTSANVLTLYIWSGSSLSDPATNVDFDVFGL
jgi:hypothetical protein